MTSRVRINKSRVAIAMDRSMYFKIRATRQNRMEGHDVSWCRCKIYTVQSEPGITPYIGYTTQELRERLKDHQYAYEKGIDDGCGVHMSTGIADIFLVEEYPCNSRAEAISRVTQYRRKYN